MDSLDESSLVLTGQAHRFWLMIMGSSISLQEGQDGCGLFNYSGAQPGLSNGTDDDACMADKPAKETAHDTTRPMPKRCPTA